MKQQKPLTVITLFEIAEDVLLLYTTDFLGSNFFSYISDNIGGYEVLQQIVRQSLSSSKKIVISLPIHAKVFRKNESEKVYFKVVEEHGKNRILYKKEDIREDFEAYLYKDRIDIAWGDPERVSIVIYEPHTHVAVFDYLKGVVPPFNPIDIAQTLASAIQHKGFCRLLCSRGLPPSSQDIESYLSKDVFSGPMNIVMCPDVWYVMCMTEATKKIDDKEEFHLEYVSVASKYKRYSKLIGLKLAVVETCKNQLLSLACGTVTEHRKWEEKDGERVTNIVENDEDYIVPQSLMDP